MKSLLRNMRLNQNKEEKKCIVVAMGMYVLQTAQKEANGVGVGGRYLQARRLRAVSDSRPLCISRNAQSRL